MKKTSELKWRLSALPSGAEVAQLVEQKVITTDEAREILFTEQSKVQLEEPEKMKSLQEEVKFLRNLVDVLASTRSGGYTVVYEQWKRYNPVFATWHTNYAGVMGKAQTLNGTATASMGLLSNNLN